MATDPVIVDVVLHRPAGVEPQRWKDHLMDACCRRLVPDLASFSIGRDKVHLAIFAGDALPANLEVVAQMHATMARLVSAAAA